MATIISGTGEYWAVRQCAQVDYTLGENRTRENYPDCDAFYSSKDPLKQTLVKATMDSDDITAEATLGLAFGPALWLAFVLHAIRIEIYVSVHAFQDLLQLLLTVRFISSVSSPASTTGSGMCHTSGKSRPG